MFCFKYDRIANIFIAALANITLFYIGLAP